MYLLLFRIDLSSTSLFIYFIVKVILKIYRRINAHFIFFFRFRIIYKRSNSTNWNFYIEESQYSQLKWPLQWIKNLRINWYRPSIIENKGGSQSLTDTSSARCTCQKHFWGLKVDFKNLLLTLLRIYVTLIFESNRKVIYYLSHL